MKKIKGGSGGGFIGGGGGFAGDWPDDIFPLPAPAAGYAQGCNVELEIGQPLYTERQMKDFAIKCVKADRCNSALPFDPTYI